MKPFEIRLAKQHRNNTRSTLKISVLSARIRAVLT